MKARTHNQNKRLFYLLSKIGKGNDKEFRADLAFQFSVGRTSSTSELSYQECEELIQSLELQTRISSHTKSRFRSADHQAGEQQRKYILSIAHEMNWENDRGEIDWKRLNAWLLKYGYLKKRLDDYKYKELPTLVTQFENLLKSFYHAKSKTQAH